tara:strand:+ start:1063 stop:1287 length:225 start_codon:yes stop_codon:yes gene_type:complete
LLDKHLLREKHPKNATNPISLSAKTLPSTIRVDQWFYFSLNDTRDKTQVVRWHPFRRKKVIIAGLQILLSRFFC